VFIERVRWGSRRESLTKKRRRHCEGSSKATSRLSTELLCLEWGVETGKVDCDGYVERRERGTDAQVGITQRHGCPIIEISLHQSAAIRGSFV